MYFLPSLWGQDTRHCPSNQLLPTEHLPCGEYNKIFMQGKRKRSYLNLLFHSLFLRHFKVRFTIRISLGSIFTSVPVVLQLLQREDVLVEVLLKLLVGIIDVKLFKPVDLQAQRQGLTYRCVMVLCRETSSTLSGSSGSVNLKMAILHNGNHKAGYRVAQLTLGSWIQLVACFQSIPVLPEKRENAYSSSSFILSALILALCCIIMNK